MQKIVIILIWFSILYSLTFAQVGIGAGGGLNYPGLSQSDNANSQFNLGAGYDIFIRHRLLKFSENYVLHAKYSVSKYFSDIKLVRVGNTRFTFNYLSVEILMPFQSYESLKLVAHAGLHLVNTTAVQRYFDSNESLLVPSFGAGAEYWFSENYNIFSLFNFQFGEFEDNGQSLPVNGFRFQVGATMFLTEQ
jgi:hypothetical protein